MEKAMGLKICQLCAVDFTLKHFLTPLIDGMHNKGWIVTSVCSDSGFVNQLNKEENNSSDTSSKSNTPSAGKLEFNYGDQIGYCNTGCIMSPREKDIYIFPAKLHHSVYPFKSKVESATLRAAVPDVTANENFDLNFYKLLY